MYWVLDLSKSGRTAIDWVVIGAVGLAILWNLFRLGQRLHDSGGGRDLWHLQRTLLFWIIGLFNTVLVRPEEIGSWKNILGWVLLGIALVDSIALYRKEHASVRRREQPSS